MKMFFEMLFGSFLLIGFYLMVYLGVFSVCLSDDVEFYHGKKRMRNRRKKQRGFWRKFLFLDIHKEVVPWHYALFWVNLISFIVMLIMGNVQIAYSNEIVSVILQINAGIFFLTATVINSVRWQLYAGNKVRNRKKYCKKYRRK